MGLHKIILLFWLTLFPGIGTPSFGYSVLGHEAIVDACWEESIVPALQKRFPESSPEEIQKSRAFAYGGSIMPDIGYFPMGSIFFSDLVHYVRGADFTEALLGEAADLNEYAFALGALTHYYADSYGHLLAVNIVVPIIYKKDRKKFGDTVTYADACIDHKRVEFAFDVLQIAKGNYSSENYAGFIGFEISKPLIERAFLKTYSIELGDVFTNFDLSVTSARLSVKNVFPALTKAAWANKKDEIEKSNPGITLQDYRYRMTNKTYRESWGKTPLHVALLSGIIKITPKIFGNTRVLRFKIPTPETEQYFHASVDTVITYYRLSLEEVELNSLQLENFNYDIGKACKMCEYSMSDKTYLKLIRMIKKNSFSNLSAEMESDILTFYSVTHDEKLQSVCDQLLKKRCVEKN